MTKIQYNKDGWVCYRYPHNLAEPVGEIEVSEEVFKETLITPTHFAWRVVDGELVNERYEEEPREEWIKNRIKELKKLLTDSDYKAIKYAEGQITEEEFAPIKAQRQAWRDEINQLEEELSSMDDIQE